MEIIARGLTVYCTDIVDTYSLKVLDFTETKDEIEIITQVYNNALKRGWIGNLSFQTHNTIDIVSCHDTDPMRDSYDDVLLASVGILSAEPDGAVIWKYRFLKK